MTGLRVVLAGPDRGIGDALEDHGATVSRLDGTLTASRLDEAGVADADVFLLTDVAEATAISLAKDANPDIQVVVYASESVPEFARAQLDLAVDPALLDAEAVAEELAG